MPYLISSVNTCKSICNNQKRFAVSPLSVFASYLKHSYIPFLVRQETRKGGCSFSTPEYEANVKGTTGAGLGLLRFLLIARLGA
jgi:hypothetical protein